MPHHKSPGGDSLWPVLHWFLLVLVLLSLPGALPPPEPAGPGQSASQSAGTLRLGAHLTATTATSRLANNHQAERLRDPKLLALAPTGALDRRAQIAVDPKLAALAALAGRQARPPRAHPVTAAAFPKWTSAQARYSARYWAHGPVFAAACTEIPASEILAAEILAADCGLADWRGFLARMAGRAPAEQLALVNAWVNRVPYRADQAVWGQRDYWAAPGEFLAAGGDCEDYAITKYFSLKDLGFPEADLRIVVLDDKRRREPHAVLVVTWQGQDLVLDSLDRRIRPWAEVRHYHAFYSFNADAYWLHSGRRISTI